MLIEYGIPGLASYALLLASAFYRARLRALDFKPGEETLEVALWEEASIPWKDIAFRTVGLTLKRWFADRGAGNFQFHAEDLV